MLRILLLVLIAYSVAGQAIYVSNASGQDGDECGSMQQPCLSVTGALAHVNSSRFVIYFDSGVYTGDLNTNLTLPLRPLVLQANSSEGTIVTLDCQGGPMAFQTAAKILVAGLTFVNCQEQAILHNPPNGSQDTTLALTAVEFRDCGVGVRSLDGKLSATGITVSGCQIGIDAQESSSPPLPREISISESIFTGSQQAAIQVDGPLKTTVSLNNVNFTDTAGLYMRALSGIMTTCQLVSVSPYHGDSFQALVVVDGLWQVIGVDILQSVDCGVAILARSLTADAETSLQYDHATWDNTCDTAIYYNTSGTLKLNQLLVATRLNGIIAPRPLLPTLYQVEFSGCSNTSLYLDMRETFSALSQTNILNECVFNNSGPATIKVSPDVNLKIVSTTFINSRLVLVDGRWTLSYVTAINDGTEASLPIDGGFISFDSSSQNSTLALYSVSVSGYHVSGRGGAIFSQGPGSFQITAPSNFTGNQAASGGAVYLLGASAATFKDGRFVDNQAQETGGAIALESETPLQVNLQSTFFSNNTAQSGACVSCCQATCSDLIQVVGESTMTYMNEGNVNLDGTSSLVTCTNDGAAPVPPAPSPPSTPPDDPTGWLPWVIVGVVVFAVCVIGAIGVAFFVHRNRQRNSFSVIE